MIGGFDVKLKWYEKLWIYPLLFIQGCFEHVVFFISICVIWIYDKFNKDKEKGE